MTTSAIHMIGIKRALGTLIIHANDCAPLGLACADQIIYGSLWKTTLLA